MGPLLIRAAERSDYDAVADMWRRSASTMDGASHEVPTFAALRARLDEEIKDEWHLYIATRDHDVVGMLAIKPTPAILDQIFISLPFQGTGIGRRLLDFSKAAMPGGFSLRVASANKRARGFYEREGLRMIGEGTHPISGIAVCFYRWSPSI